MESTEARLRRWIDYHKEEDEDYYALLIKDLELTLDDLIRLKHIPNKDDLRSIYEQRKAGVLPTEYKFPSLEEARKIWGLE